MARSGPRACLLSKGTILSLKRQLHKFWLRESKRLRIPYCPVVIREMMFRDRDKWGLWSLSGTSLILRKVYFLFYFLFWTSCKLLNFFLVIVWVYPGRGAEKLAPVQALYITTKQISVKSQQIQTTQSVVCLSVFAPNLCLPEYQSPASPVVSSVWVVRGNSPSREASIGTQGKDMKAERDAGTMEEPWAYWLAFLVLTTFFG